MEVFTMVVLIVLISCGASVANSYLKNQRLEKKSVHSEAVVEELAALRARVEVLEEIVTDNRYQLDRELDRLERQA